MRRKKHRSAMILAAGQGSRMGDLGERSPKTLLNVGGKPLLQHHIEKLQAAGFSRIVINASHLKNQIKDFVASQVTKDSEILVSEEESPLETAGGIAKALKLIDANVVAVINGDVFTEIDYGTIFDKTRSLEEKAQYSTFLFLVDNPAHNPNGDFMLHKNKLVNEKGTVLTYSGIGVYKTELFKNISTNTKTPLAPTIKKEIKLGRVLGCHHKGFWYDVGTPDRLRNANLHAEKS